MYHGNVFAGMVDRFHTEERMRPSSTLPGEGVDAGGTAGMGVDGEAGVDSGGVAGPGVDGGEAGDADGVVRLGVESKVAVTDGEAGGADGVATPLCH